MEESNDVVQCTVCKTTPAAPRLFPCGHVICAKCLAGTISNGYDEQGDLKPNRQMHCPTCRKSFSIPTAGLEHLPLKSSTAESDDIKNVQKTLTANTGSSDITSQHSGPIEQGISFTNTSKSMLTKEEKTTNVIPTVNAVTIDTTKTQSAEVFTTASSLDPNVTKSQLPTPDLMDARLPLQSLVSSTAIHNGSESDTTPYPLEDELSVDEDTRSNTSTELTNFCSICKLTGKYVSASSYCLTCGCLVCSSCTKIHMEHSPDRDHVLVSLTNENLNTVLCRSHDQLIRFFCLTCCLPVCKACLMEHHTQHKMSDYLTAFRENPKTKQLGRHVQSHLKELRLQKSTLSKAHEAAEMNRRDTNMTIIKTIDSQIRYLQEKRQELVDRSDQYHGLVKEQMNNVEREVDRASAVMQNLQLKVDTSLYPLPPHSHVIPAIFPINVIQKKFSTIVLPSKDHRDFGVSGCSYVQGAAVEAGQLETGIAVSSNELTEINISKSNRKVKVKVLWNKAVEVHDIHFLPHSKDLLFTDIGRGYTMHKLNCDGKLAPLLVGLSGFAGRACTFGINNYTGYKIIAYKPEPKGNDMVLSIFSDDVNSTDVNLVGATFPPGYNTLVSVTITQDEYIIAILSDDPDEPKRTSVCCFDLTGHLLWQRNTSPSSRAGDLDFPVFVTVDMLDRIIITDRDGAKVNIYTSDGSHLLTFPQLGEDQANRKLKPTGVCVDARGRILVAFWDLQVVSLFTANGAFVRHVVQTPGPPWGISLCDDGRYLVVALEDHGLWLYDLGDID